MAQVDASEITVRKITGLSGCPPLVELVDLSLTEQDVELVVCFDQRYRIHGSPPFRSEIGTKK
jgi:hypothetical protein